MSLRKPYTTRSVIRGGGSLRLSLPKADLVDHDISIGEKIPGQWRPDEDEFRIILDAYDDAEALQDDYERAFAVQIIDIGEAEGITLPADICSHHGISDDHTLLLQGIESGWAINLDEGETDRDRVVA